MNAAARTHVVGRLVRTAQQRAESYCWRERGLFPRGRVVIDFVWG